MRRPTNTQNEVKSSVGLRGMVYGVWCVYYNGSTEPSPGPNKTIIFLSRLYLLVREGRAGSFQR